MMRSGAIKGAGPFFSGREPDVPAIQSYPHAEANLPTRYPTHRKQRGGKKIEKFADFIDQHLAIEVTF
jgi:hypothetical protein